MSKKYLLIVLLFLNTTLYSMNKSETNKLLADNYEPEGQIEEEVSSVEGEELVKEIDQRQKYLLEEFGDINIANKLNDCFLKLVGKNDCLERAEYYFENKIGDINLKNERGQTPLMLAVADMDFELVELFIKNGAKMFMMSIQ